MHLFVGLGNPGPKFARHRHNIGFLAVDRIAERYGFGQPRRRFQGFTMDGVVDGEKVVILKPTTYMNESGRSVGEAVRFYKMAADQVVVFHDELDLAAGKLRVKFDGGTAGHNGIRSIASHIGADFHRIRLGIGHPGNRDRVTGHVLGDFSAADRQWLEAFLDAVADASPWLAKGDGPGFATRVALVLAPPKPDKKPDPDKPPKAKSQEQ